jgi:hypothetical protein
MWVRFSEMRACQAQVVPKQESAVVYPMTAKGLRMLRDSGN